jgi:hypothetical protein
MTSSAHIPPIVTRSTKLCNRAGAEETIHEDTLAKVFGAVVTFCSPLAVTRGRSRSRFSVRSYAITDGRMQRSPLGSPSYALRVYIVCGPSCTLPFLHDKGHCSENSSVYAVSSLGYPSFFGQRKW